MQDSIYCGNAKKVGQDGFSIELNLTQLKAFLESAEAKEHIRTYQGQNGKNETLKLVAWPLKQPQTYRTHSVKVDTWKPEQKAEQVPPSPKSEQEEDDLPF